MTPPSCDSGPPIGILRRSNRAEPDRHTSLWALDPHPDGHCRWQTVESTRLFSVSVFLRHFSKGRGSAGCKNKGDSSDRRRRHFVVDWVHRQDPDPMWCLVGKGGGRPGGATPGTTSVTRRLLAIKRVRVRLRRPARPFQVLSAFRMRCPVPARGFLGSIFG